MQIDKWGAGRKTSSQKKIGEKRARSLTKAQIDGETHEPKRDATRRMSFPKGAATLKE